MHLAFSAALLIMSRLVPGATVVALPEPQLVERVDAIGFGTIVSTKAVVDEWGGVRTQAQLEIYRAVRGLSNGDVITVEVPGGEISGGIRSVVAGSPSLVPGQMVFGFFEARSGRYVPWGLSFGLLRVRYDGDKGYRVFRDTHGLRMMSPGGALAPQAVTRLHDVPLDALVHRIQNHLAILGISEGTGVGQ